MSEQNERPAAAESELTDKGQKRRTLAPCLKKSRVWCVRAPPIPDGLRA